MKKLNRVGFFIILYTSLGNSLYAVENHFTLKLDEGLIKANPNVVAWITVLNPKLHTNMMDLDKAHAEKLIPLGNRYDVSITLKFVTKEGEKEKVDYKKCTASYQNLKDGFAYILGANIKENGACTVTLAEMS